MRGWVCFFFGTFESRNYISKESPHPVTENSIAETPLMKQYMQFKKKHPDAILLFRVGDFYETFADDAIEASQILGITLTKRANGSAQHVELAGFPHHALDTYLPKLVRAGKRVAICDQLEDPKMTTKLVKRGITEIVTPGVATTDNVLQSRQNNFLAAIYPNAKSNGSYGLALLDLSTGEFYATECSKQVLTKLISGYNPKEILIERKHRDTLQTLLHPEGHLSDYDDWIFSESNNRQRLLQHFGTLSLKGFGLECMPLAITAAGAILHYLDMTMHTEIGHITRIVRIDEQRHVRIDGFTAHSLELSCPMNPGGTTLRQILDRTVTPMGSRLLDQWISFPLKDLAEILQRQSIVANLVESPQLRIALTEQMKEVGDLQRLVGRVAMGRITPREVVRLGLSIALLAPIRRQALDEGEETLVALCSGLDPCTQLCQQISYQLLPDAPQQIGKGPTIAEGVCEELDQLRRLLHSGKQYLDDLLQREIDQTGISSLKIGFNNVFGYYLEVRNTYKEQVPESWIRKQTLVSAERYITQELKGYEEKILGAEDRILTLEQELFTKLILTLQQFAGKLLQNAHTLAQLDALASLASVAEAYNYCRPSLSEDYDLEIVEGRHPVIEQTLPTGQPYIPNDVQLSPIDCQIMIITGPNMSGKSALLRQTALITIMAQMGSYVPASSARIGIVDSVYTRVGASDNIAVGESTFMVEMQEAASILNNVTPRSLILFDELGRGTSTFDGVSIAWAIVEYLHSTTQGRAKTLFATHYHELNELAERLERVRCYNVSAREIDGEMLFLRKLVPGGSAHSFGIQVAKLAGMPTWIVARANEVLKHLEAYRTEGECVTGAEQDKMDRQFTASSQGGGVQMSIFQLDDPVLTAVRAKINELDIDNLTPLDALKELDALKKMLNS